MGVRDDFRQLADEIRAIAGPDYLDVRPSKLTIVTRTWSGGARDKGSPSDVFLEVPDIYQFDQLATHEISGSAGRYEVGDIIVGPITPNFNSGPDSGGFSESDLKPSVFPGVETIYRVIGQHAGDYGLVEMRSLEVFSYYLVLRRLRTTR